MKLTEDQVEWVVNDIAELGVKIGDQFFFCYKGRSLVYDDPTHERYYGANATGLRSAGGVDSRGRPC